MYAYPELIGKRPQMCVDSPSPRLFFSIYYREDDHAFRRAAQTWKRVVKRQESFRSGTDLFYEKQVNYEAGFKTAWQEVASLAAASSAVVWVGQLFTHASKGSSDDGLEFRQSPDSTDTTLNRRDISALTRLPWDPEMGYLILSGCNTGLTGTRGWNPAAVFASSQQVLTIGQSGYGYFSKRWDTYRETSATDTGICLWAYRRRRNSFFGNGSRMPGVVFRP